MICYKIKYRNSFGPKHVYAFADSYSEAEETFKAKMCKHDIIESIEALGDAIYKNSCVVFKEV